MCANCFVVPPRSHSRHTNWTKACPGQNKDHLGRRAPLHLLQSMLLCVCCPPASLPPVIVGEGGGESRYAGEA